MITGFVSVPAAFVELLKECGGDRYEFHMRETQTYDIIDDVAHLRSDIGILYLNSFNETVIRKTLRDNSLSFTSLFKAKPLNVDDYIEIGYILPGTIHPSQLTLNYIEILKKLV